MPLPDLTRFVANASLHFPVTILYVLKQTATSASAVDTTPLRVLAPPTDCQ